MRRDGLPWLLLVACMATLALPLPLPLRAQPALVVMFRHRNKDAPAAANATPNYNLSFKGLELALQLARLVPACLQQGRPLRLVSYGFDPESGKNARSYQTLMPLAVASKANIHLYPNAPSDSTSIGRQLRSDPGLTGSVLVIAWEHQHLPLLASGLGWAHMPVVDDDDFDSIWLLHYGREQKAPAVVVRSQLMLQTKRCVTALNQSNDPMQRLLQRMSAAIELNR